MSAISKASSFPATVQPGLPSLPQTPSGWAREPIGLHLKEVRRPVKLQDDQSYRLVTAKRARGGIVNRGTLFGHEVAVKSQFWLQDGDFLISKRQIVHGACGIVPKELEGSIVSNEYAVLRCNVNLDVRFLTYLAHSIYFQQTCFHSSIGVHIEKMIFKTEEWLNWEFNLPPLPEQKKIADILSTWDEAIEATGKLLANAEAQKRALMQQLLTGKRRLKGFEDREWRTVALNEIVDVKIGGTPSRAEPAYWAQAGHPWLAISDLGPKNVWETQECITDEGVKKSSVKLIPEGTVIMSFKLTIGKLGITSRPIYTNEAICAFVPLKKDMVDAEFLYYVLHVTNLLGDVDQAIKGKTLNKVKLRALKIVLPRMDEQLQIARILNCFDHLIEAEQLKLSYLQSEKRALMQQLLTGKRRVIV